MRAIIVDDELLVAQNLNLLLKRYCPEVEVLQMAHSAADAERLIKELEPDLIFLDVEMPGGNGFDLLKRFTQIRFGIIFVTAFDHYAIQAIKFSAIDYLLKPIDINELKGAVAKAQEQLKNRSINQSLNILLHNMAQPATKLQKLSLPTQDGMTFIAINDIIYCESDGNYTIFYLDDGQKLLITRQIGVYEELLPEPLFCRIHRQYIINVNKVARYVKGRGGHVVMTDGQEIDVAVRKKEDFLNAYSLI
ncbi:MAG: response regulator transcription factor [Bacteroidetes bacterium]|nr:response regulator transcription factor [Bacteroidota bacterium]